MARGGGVIRIGVGGWTYEPWRGAFYPAGTPQKRELEYASRHLTSIEINGTFYGSQKPESFAKWHDETPEDFVFALKGPRFATNRRKLGEAGESVERFVNSGILELKAKLGPINWQFATTKSFDPVDFDAFLSLLPKTVRGRALQHAVEVRHASFQNAEFVALARRHGVAIVVGADSHHPVIPDATAPFVYARIMGTTEVEENGYADDRLDAWIERARAWSLGNAPPGLAAIGPEEGKKQPRDVFLYVISGHKAVNPRAAMALIDRLRGIGKQAAE